MILPPSRSSASKIVVSQRSPQVSARIRAVNSPPGPPPTIATCFMKFPEPWTEPERGPPIVSLGGKTGLKTETHPLRGDSFHGCFPHPDETDPALPTPLPADFRPVLPTVGQRALLE